MDLTKTPRNTVLKVSPRAVWFRGDKAALDTNFWIVYS